MYFLLIGVHLLFFFIAHLLSSILMQGAFVLLLLFFLLYFSPLFFSNRPSDAESGIQLPELNISPKKTILIPLILTYIGIYVLAFTVTRDLGDNFNLHLYILLLIFAIFGGYVFAFDWNTVFFRDALRFHLIGSYITIVIQLLYFFGFSGDVSFIHILFSFVTIGFSYFFFTYFGDENIRIFLAFILSTLISIDLLVLYGFPDTNIFTIIGFTGIFMILFFEHIPKIKVFRQYIEPTRILLLTAILGFSIVLMSSLFFSDFHFIYFLPIFTVFLFSIHIRYSNYVSYFVAIFLLFFSYTYLFSSLLVLSDILSALLFIFFFSLCIIGSTYFWEEKYPYDFSLMHYSSIGFSIVTGLYSLFLVPWGAGLTLFLACYLFLLASLFLLSYFRFQYK